ncbi:FadR/GntR family transcriptional regulator, partial [Tateyamaria sp. syn59]|uniref:FadR/GntR family transcriptional regulator n=1 Tax=Tateyamaria sp. syn59 TaxID=2576942 RepID=UPI0011BF7203
LGEVFQTRILIEGEMARLAAGALGPEGLATLRRQADLFESAWRDGDLVAHVEADLAFHSAVAAACPNAMLKRLYASIQELLTETQRRPIPNTETARMRASIEEHRAILTALKRADAEAAAAAMRTHISNTAACAGIRLDLSVPRRE